MKQYIVSITLIISSCLCLESQSSQRKQDNKTDYKQSVEVKESKEKKELQQTEQPILAQAPTDPKVQQTTTVPECQTSCLKCVGACGICCLLTLAVIDARNHIYKTGLAKGAALGHKQGFDDANELSFYKHMGYLGSSHDLDYVPFSNLPYEGDCFNKCFTPESFGGRWLNSCLNLCEKEGQRKIDNDIRLARKNKKNK